MSDDPISFDHLSSLDPKSWNHKICDLQLPRKPLELILPDLMAASSRLSEQGLSFTNEEISMIIDGLKESMSPEEQQRIDMIRPLIM